MFETGKITEFGDFPVTLTITNTAAAQNSFVVKMEPSTVKNMFNVTCYNSRYCATRQQARQHIIDSIEIASMSQGTAPYIIQLKVPMYPHIEFDTKNTASMMPLITKVLDNYM